MSGSPLRIAVLASGNGSNLQAILDAWKKGTLTILPVLVISDKEKAHALERARQAGVEAIWCDPKATKERVDYDKILVERLLVAKIELIVLAGFMRILSPYFVNAFKNRIINLHPALLPSFPGLHSIQQALDSGVQTTGCTVHFVDSGVDTGPIILQKPVAIAPGETLTSLQDKVHAAEHLALVETLGLFAARRVAINGRTVTITPG